MDLNSRKRYTKRYTKSQVHELKSILEKYHDQHLTIRKALKIPASSFLKIKKEIEEDNLNLKVRDRYQSNKTDMNEVEKF